jgi:CheY-like chemotaxis protein
MRNPSRDAHGAVPAGSLCRRISVLESRPKMSDRRRSVLVVDDDRGTLQTYQHILSLAGYDIVTAAAGREGLELLRHGRDVDLVLADLRMEDVSGLEMLADIHEHGPNVAVVVMTAFSIDESEETARALDAAEFVGKPWEPDGIVELARRNIDKALKPGYAALRWAEDVVAVTRLAEDVSEILEWGRTVGKSQTTLKSRSHACCVTAGDSLDLARVLRVVKQQTGRICDWHAALDIQDPRTIVTWLMLSTRAVWSNPSAMTTRTIPGISSKQSASGGIHVPPTADFSWRWNAGHAGNCPFR